MSIAPRRMSQGWSSAAGMGAPSYSSAGAPGGWTAVIHGGNMGPGEGHVFEVAYETTFCATHVLHDGGKAIEPQHGHDWRVEVVATGKTLDRLGVVVDFEHLKRAVGEICRRFHYGDITSHPDFAGQSPSAEAVARYFFREVRGEMGSEGQRLARVRVWEAPGCSATYSE